MRQETVRTSVDLPLELHKLLREEAAKRGCSTRQLVLRCIEQAVPAPPATEQIQPKRRLTLQVPIVPSTGKTFDLTSEEIYDLVGFP